MSTKNQDLFRKLELTSEQVKGFKRSWMQCIQSKIPDLFYACCENKQGDFETHRAIAYNLGDSIGHALAASEYQKVQIHMGCDPTKPPTDHIYDEPPFVPIIGFVGKDKKKKYFRLFWDPDIVVLTPIPDRENPSNQKIETKISREVALEFIYGWCDCLYGDLHAPFEANVISKKHRGPLNNIHRVNHYEFNEKDSKEIIEHLKAGKTHHLSIFLGIGHSHKEAEKPFKFKPIVHLTKSEERRINNKEMSETVYTDVATFEFVSPCPPLCNE